MSRISLTINGELVEADVEPRTSLADFLRHARGLTLTSRLVIAMIMLVTIAVFADTCGNLIQIYQRA